MKIHENPHISYYYDKLKKSKLIKKASKVEKKQEINKQNKRREWIG